MATCAFLGLGVMGGPMARHLSQKGHDVTVWNRSPEKAAAWLEKGGKGKVAARARELRAHAQAIVERLGIRELRRLRHRVSDRLRRRLEIELKNFEDLVG